MSVYESFSKRMKREANAGKQDVYQYDDLPSRFRGQVVHLGSASTLGALDIIQLSFRVIDRGVRQMSTSDAEAAGITLTPDRAIENLNLRFREHNIGYQYLDGLVIRMDSKFAHEEIVKPALSLLNGAGFDGPAEEFLKAFEHRSHGRNKEAINEALKAFESTIKAICLARNWPVPSTLTASGLIAVVFERDLIPPELSAQFGSLRGLLESGIPTIRNRTSGHGQGAVPVDVPAHLVAYALHLAASNIIFLVEAHKALK